MHGWSNTIGRHVWEESTFYYSISLWVMKTYNNIAMVNESSEDSTLYTVEIPAD